MRFGIIGAAGFVAPRHMQAIAQTGNEVVAALDPSDSVGIMDSYFPKAAFFTEFERFDRHVDLMRRRGEQVDYVSICSPNYLHDSHMRYALRAGAHAICEKPLVLNPWNIDALESVEEESGKKISSILQLRLHESVLELKKRVECSASDEVMDVDLNYVTSRGSWYQTSWKGSSEKSGGIASNIGVHFFDMLHFIFGELKTNVLHIESPTHAAGYLEFSKARVRWFLSIDENHLPQSAVDAGLRTHRSLTIGGDEFEFSKGFTDLHTKSYEAILAGNGFGLRENQVAIEIVSELRNLTADLSTGDVHPFARGIAEL